MEYTELKLPGFTIALKSTVSTEGNSGAITVLPDQLAEKITDFLKDQIKQGVELHVKLSIANWDDDFVLEETIFKLKNEKENENNKSYSRNYWIKSGK